MESSHDDGCYGLLWSSIYFMDPNAVTLELTYHARALNDADAARAIAMVARWTARNSSPG